MCLVPFRSVRCSLFHCFLCTPHRRGRADANDVHAINARSVGLSRQRVFVRRIDGKPAMHSALLPGTYTFQNKYVLYAVRTGGIHFITLQTHGVHGVPSIKSPFPLSGGRRRFEISGRLNVHLAKST